MQLNVTTNIWQRQNTCLELFCAKKHREKIFSKLYFVCIVDLRSLTLSQKIEYSLQREITLLWSCIEIWTYIHDMPKLNMSPTLLQILNVIANTELSYEIRDKQIYNRNRNCHVATDVYLTSHTERLNHSLRISSHMKKNVCRILTN